MKTQAPSIVLIENDEVTLELYQRELCKSFTVFAFTEISGVLETMSNRDIRAVVIEPEVHFGQGWKLIHAIHKAFPEQLIPVIVCSTRDADGTDLAEEIAKHLTKPVLPKTLREKTLEVISGENERRESS